MKDLILTHKAEPHPDGGYNLSVRYYGEDFAPPYHCPNVRPEDLPLITERCWPGLIQDSFPHLTPDEREYILTGLRPEDWDAIML